MNNSRVFFFFLLSPVYVRGWILELSKEHVHVPETDPGGSCFVLPPFRAALMQQNSSRMEEEIFVGIADVQGRLAPS